MIRLSDYTVDGKTNWKAYDEAKKVCGESCNRCGSHILFSKGYRTTCDSCKSLLYNRGEVYRNEKGIRCPNCGRASNDPYDYGDDIYGEGLHEITCIRCDHEFEVETHVEFSWTSPAMIESKLGADDDGMDDSDD